MNTQMYEALMASEHVFLEAEQQNVDAMVHDLRKLHLELMKSDEAYARYLDCMLRVYEEMIESPECAGRVDTREKFARKQAFGEMVKRYGTSREEAGLVFEEIVATVRGCYAEYASERKSKLEKLRPASV